MRLLANENIPRDAIAALRARGFDVAWVKEDAPGARDAEVLERAIEQQRVLLTFDKDFGELAFSAGLPAASGVILLRFPTPSSGDIGERIAQLVSAREDWTGKFSVVEPARIRMRNLPAS